MKTHIISLIIIPVFFYSCLCQNSKRVETVDVDAFAGLIKTTNNAQLVDVRTPQEYNTSHIENAVNIDWFDADFISKFSSYNKEEPVFVYCKSGRRSLLAANKLAEAGFTKIYDLGGGILKWEGGSPEVIDEKTAGISKAEYDKLVSSKKKVLVNIFAPWCPPCKKMEPYVLQLQKDLATDVLIVRLNADENKTIVRELKLEDLPGLYLYENNTLKWKATGFVSEEELKKQL